MTPINELKLVDGAVTFPLDMRSYRLSAVKKTAYRFADRCTAILGAEAGNELPMTLRFKPSTSETAAREVVHAFFQDLLDQELRELVADETASVRTLILAHAFSNVDIIKRDP